MLTVALAKKIESLSMDEYRMVEAYVDKVVECSKENKKDAVWEKVQKNPQQVENFPFS